MGRGKYGTYRLANALAVSLLDTTYGAVCGVLSALAYAFWAVLSAALVLGTQLRQRIAAADLVVDPVDDATDNDTDNADPASQDGPVQAVATRLDREDDAA
jgi:hypothetical protein